MRDVSGMPRYSKFEKQIGIEKFNVWRKPLLCVPYDRLHMNRHSGVPYRTADRQKAAKPYTDEPPSLSIGCTNGLLIAGFVVPIRRNNIRKCFKHELETSQIMSIQSGFYSQIGNLSTVSMRRTADLSKHSRLSISARNPQSTKSVSILKHQTSFTYD